MSEASTSYWRVPPPPPFFWRPWLFLLLEDIVPTLTLSLGALDLRSGGQTRSQVQSLLHQVTEACGILKTDLTLMLRHSSTYSPNFLLLYLLKKFQRSPEMTMTISSPSVRGSGRPSERALPVFGDHDRIPGSISLDPQNCSADSGRLILSVSSYAIILTYHDLILINIRPRLKVYLNTFRRCRQPKLVPVK